MGKINLIGAVAATVILSFCNNSIAATILTESCPDPSGCLTGVLGIELENELYDVDFQHKSFIDLNSLGAFPMFGDEAWAVSAANALNLELINFPTPTTVVGPNTLNQLIIASGFSIPFEFTQNTSEAQINVIVSFGGITGGGNLNNWGVHPVPGCCLGSTSELMYAAFTKVSPIPEPSTMLLFGTGLAPLVAWRYRKSVKG